MKSLRGGDDVTESAGEPPPEDPVGVRYTGVGIPGLISVECGGTAGDVFHLENRAQLVRS